MCAFLGGSDFSTLPLGARDGLSTLVAAHTADNFVVFMAQSNNLITF